MAAYAYVIIKDASGVKKSVLTAAGKSGGQNGYLSLAWIKKVNDVDVCKVKLLRSNPDVALFTDRCQLEVWRANPAIGLAEYKSLDCVFRDDETYTDDQNITYFTATAYGTNMLLAEREIAYPAGLTDLSEFTSKPAETIMKRLVDYNIGANALATNQRDYDGVRTGFSVASDLGGGNTMSIGVSRINLLQALQKVAAKAGGDFAVVQTGATTYQFRFYPGQLGTDRSAAVMFSMAKANMANPRLQRIRSSEKTTIFVGGSGEGTNRVVRRRTGANYSSSNNAELFVEYTNTNNATILDGIGDTQAELYKFRNLLTYDVRQTTLTAVEKDYFLGDKVKAFYSNVTVTQKIDEIAFTYGGPVELVDVRLRDL